MRTAWTSPTPHLGWRATSARPIVHARRPEVTRHQPVHVSLRVVADVGRLRRRDGYAAVRRALMVCVGREAFRIPQISIQANHVHLLVEADDKRALADGLRAFMIAAARRRNRATGRTGRVFERFHMTVIRTPRQARHALGYVLCNWRRHREDLAGARQRRTPIDPYSSGPRFDGWRDPPADLRLPPGYEPLPTGAARSWLLTVGWRAHHPPLDWADVPGPRAA
jgi:putative transposase